jgi:hypothetical protein
MQQAVKFKGMDGMSSNNSNRISGSEKIIPDGSEIQALRIARLHIESCRNLKEWKDADAVDIFPLYGSGKPSEITHYEIKVSSPEQRDSGYIIVSASEETSPIPVFAVSGKTFTERLRAKSGYTETRIVWHHPFSATAMDAKGEVVAVIGTEHKKKKTAKKKPPTGMIKPLGWTEGAFVGSGGLLRRVCLWPFRPDNNPPFPDR